MGLSIPTQPDEVSASWMEAAMAAAPGSLASMTLEPLPQGGLAGRLLRAELGWVGAWPDALATGALAPVPRTIVHGDFDLRNVAFRDGSLIAFDWQQTGLADPGTTCCS